jgi:hypothetical protein
LLGFSVLNQLPEGHAAYLTGRGFFPALISGPFSQGLTVAFGFAIAACLVAAIASYAAESTSTSTFHRSPSTRACHPQPVAR